MYYRKYFSGTIDNLAVLTGNTVTSSTTGAGGMTTLYYRSLKTTPVLCRAIVEVLQEIGLTEAACRLEPGDPATYGEIFPYGADMQGMQVYFGYQSGSNCHYSARVTLCPDSNVNAAKNAADSWGVSLNIQIASATSGSNVPYRFYVTVKGDPVSFLQVAVSAYSAPEKEIGLFGFGKGKDCFGNDVVCYTGLSSNPLYFFDARKKTYVNQLTPAAAAANSLVSNTAAEIVVKGCPEDAVALIPWIDVPLAGVTLDNCYCVPTSLTTATAEQAFLIGGEEYWLLRNGRILARCPTKLN